jgi:membrane protein implicated in regulation of membrane protease activity
VRYQNGEVLGDWSERTRGAAGRVAGTIKGDQVNVRVEGQTFSALLSLTTRGDKQSISITAPVGREMSEASITLNRRG